MEHIDDPDDPRVDDFRDLRRRSADTGSGAIVIEGAVALGVVVRSEVPLRSILLNPARVEVLASTLAVIADDVRVMVADRHVLAQIVGFDLHRGVLASAHRPHLGQPDELLPTMGRVVVAEALNDHENLGALFRNAAAFGFDGVLLDDRTADPLYRRSIRVSSGWAAVLPHTRVGSLPGAYDVLRRHGFRIVALTPSAEAVPVAEVTGTGLFDDRVALVVGAEGPGLSAGALDGADARVRIPMAPGVDSINVATSLAVVGAFAASRNGSTL